MPIENRAASIDIGSNSTRLLIGKISEKRLVREKIFTEVTRTSEGFRDGFLSKERLSHLLEVLIHYRDIVKEEGLQNRYFAYATGVFRKVKKEILDYIKKATALNIYVISPQMEAFISSAGAIYGMGKVFQNLLIFDLGGFSLEIVWIKNGFFYEFISREFGVFVAKEILEEKGETALFRRIESEISFLKNLYNFEILGVGGTITTIAALKKCPNGYDPDVINGSIISKDDLVGSLSKIERFPNVTRGREDTLYPGALVFCAILSLLKRDYLYVSDFGPLEGGLLYFINFNHRSLFHIDSVRDFNRWLLA